MAVPMSVVTRKGQVTIPVEIRRALGIEEGDKVSFTLVESGDGVVQLRRIGSVAERTYGAARTNQPPGDVHEWRRLFEEGVAEEVEEVKEELRALNDETRWPR